MAGREGRGGGNGGKWDGVKKQGKGWENEGMGGAERGHPWFLFTPLAPACGMKIGCRWGFGTLPICCIYNP